jgi:chaperone BCS1
VDKITNDYLEQIELSRVGKQYIYTMLSVKGNTEHEDNDDVEEKDICKNGIVWNETIFETVKSFDNVYFRNKTEIMDKIHFFLNNKDWYYQHGIPYTLGIGLHGPPGTGKTSFIKALARHTGRHIVCISMKVVTTRNQLQSVFYETRYNMNNSYIGFKDKIIVFEDIDCTGNIVLDREYQKPEDIVSDSTKDNLVDNEFECGGVVERKPKGWNEIQKDKALTLDDILNMWDGIRETPGRILIITSNFYNRLDKALIRPGRIDIEVETTVEDAATFKNTLSLKN